MSAITVLVLVLKTSVILGTALIAVRLATRARAASRHLVLAAAFVAVLILPAAMRLLPGRVVSLPLARPERTAALIAATPRESTTVIAQVTSVASPRTVAVSVDTVIGVVWAAGMVVSLIPLLGSVALRLSDFRSVPPVSALPLVR